MFGIAYVAYDCAFDELLLQKVAHNGRQLNEEARLMFLAPVMADVTKGIRGYGTDTREYAAKIRESYSSIFGHTQVYATKFAGHYQRLSKFTQIFANTRIGYSPIRGHTRTFAQVHRDVSAYALGHISPMYL